MARQREKPKGFLPLSQRPDLKVPVNNTDTPTVVDPFSSFQLPKLKFQFTVTIKFRNPPIDLSTGVNPIQSVDGKLTDSLTFAVKQASRPNPSIVYQDINQYNYRSKVATKMDYGAMQVTMYDDVENYAHDLYEIYLKSVSPIANIRKDQADNLATNSEGPKNMAFNSNAVLDGSNERLPAGTGSIGPLPPKAQAGLIENISIRHWYYALASRRGGDNDKVPEIQYVEYQFLNPKVINMTLDELDMGQSEASTVMMNFNYDSVFIDSPKSVDLDVKFEILPPEANTFTLNDVRGRLADIERLYRRVRRVDTIPDIPVISTISAFIPPISGNIASIALPKPNIDLPESFNF